MNRCWINLGEGGRCPYRLNDEWAAIKADPKAWADALEFDEAIRNQPESKGTAFLHHTATPLKDVDLRGDEELGQHLMGFAMECDGMCGL